MKIVINMAVKAYQTLLEKQHMPDGLDLEWLIMHGTPLPEGCGRLIDADELCKNRVSNDPVVIAAKCATTIVEADPESQN